MNKFLGKILDFFYDLKPFKSLKEKSNNKIIKALFDKEFMIHIIKYIIIGILTTIICLVLFWIFINLTPLGQTDLGENIANFLSIVITIIIAYILNRCFVFNSKEKNILKEFSKFVVARIISMLFDILCFYIFATLLRFDEMIVKIIIQVAVVILNYILSKIMVFTKKEKTPKI